jgi:hypothetical protein
MPDLVGEQPADLLSRFMEDSCTALPVSIKVPWLKQLSGRPVVVKGTV